MFCLSAIVVISRDAGLSMDYIMRSIVLLLVVLQGCLAYDGYQVFRIIPKTLRHIEALNHVDRELGDGVSVWNDVHPNKPVNVHASPLMVNSLTDYMKRHGLQAELVMKDLGQAIINQVADRTPLEGDALANFTFDEYHPFDEIEEWMVAIVEANSNVSELVTIGYTYEQQPIYAVRVSLDLNATTPRPVIWLDSGIHAREWVAPATMVFFIDKFLADYQTDEVLSKSLETHDWYFMPVFNVDGYRFTWVKDNNGTFPNRLWRRTRTPGFGQPDNCFGADPNRNWDVKWGTTSGISFEPCSTIYCGTSPWSEPSVREVAFFLRDKVDVDVYFAYHSYSQYFMLPYGYTSEEAADYSELMEVCQRGAARVKAVHGKDYRCDSLIKLVGQNSGSSVDFVYDIVGTKYTFGVELRDDGTAGFVLPPEEIIPTAEENWPFVLQVVEDFMKSTSSASQITSSFIQLLMLASLSTFITLSKLV